MTQKVIKFGPADLIKFIEIYRRHKCLWDTDNVHYKNRDARNAALAAFSEEFDVEGFEAKEITTKIKNLRTQYHAERKKIKDSMRTSSSTGAGAIYKCKLFWYPLMDSFLGKTSQCMKTSNMIDTSLESQDIIIECIDSKESIINLMNGTIQAPEGISTPPKQKKTSHIESILEKVDNVENRVRHENKDDIDNFGKYVTSSLKTLSAVNSVHAQQEIQSVLSKYKLKDLNDKQTSSSMPEPSCSRQAPEDTWYS